MNRVFQPAAVCSGDGQQADFSSSKNPLGRLLATAGKTQSQLQQAQEGYGDSLDEVDVSEFANLWGEMDADTTVMYEESQLGNKLGSERDNSETWAAEFSTLQKVQEFSNRSKANDLDSKTEVDEWCQEFQTQNYTGRESIERTEDVFAKAFADVSNVQQSHDRHNDANEALFGRAEAQELTAALEQAGSMNAKLRESAFASFVSGLAQGQMQLRDNNLTDSRGQVVDWDEVYSSAVVEDPLQRSLSTGLAHLALDERRSDELYSDAFEKMKSTSKESTTDAELNKMFENLWQDHFTDVMQQTYDSLGRKFESIDEIRSQTTDPYRFALNNPYVETESPGEIGRRLAMDGDIKGAIMALEAEVSRDPDSSEGWRILGELHADNEEDNEAIECLKRGHQADPYNLKSLLALGVSLVNELHQGEALMYLKMWLENQESEVDGFCGFREPLQQNLSERRKQLLALFERACAIRPHDVDTHIAAGVVCNINEDPMAAFHHFSTALTHSPENERAAIWNKLGATLANHDHEMAAILAYHQSLPRKPTYTRAWSNLGVAHNNLGQHDKACQFYLSALSLNPSAEHLWNYLMASLRKLKQPEIPILMEQAANKNLTPLMQAFRATVNEGTVRANYPMKECQSVLLQIGSMINERRS